MYRSKGGAGKQRKSLEAQPRRKAQATSSGSRPRAAAAAAVAVGHEQQQQQQPQPQSSRPASKAKGQGIPPIRSMHSHYSSKTFVGDNPKTILCRLALGRWIVRDPRHVSDARCQVPRCKAPGGPGAHSALTRSSVPGSPSRSRWAKEIRGER